MTNLIQSCKTAAYPPMLFWRAPSLAQFYPSGWLKNFERYSKRSCSFAMTSMLKP